MRSIVRTNKYLKLLLQSTLSRQAQFMIRNQQSSMLKIQSQVFSDSDEEFSLSEPENDLAENLETLVGFEPFDSTEAFLL